MPIVNRIAAFDEDMKKWRRSIHQNPELGLDCYETCLLYTSPSPRDLSTSRMPSSA